ncbi:Mannosyltransferase [Komagataella phaffii CBS 7435]|uniref:Chitobiosyldiphosphodolichol beta-mannosyltransferase n=2 Tax=Komagataella phaffii TaxID=460519 RepID=C4R1N8_KOMPG|nr:Mannosyltransferase, involved in asparagine-linked glycosylation in the endoplasmic reticulum (ER) [Komagataella phaffii GS115]AOA62075.1 GQ67_00829T0 [Komagataella phaffii]CAH2448055.1 Mannosyltransferase [Komagataella phaffii CBS 7435]AOA67971.1 GQ68_00560T0 [Komagataella phaffii GS115]CAY69412.1 Mannosyltransferase, involved in asparagine-linked glycosylation in the endoplasmic reticulum (ER) [Komagataella phaffii GS115]CCA38202.2 Mannosyltransferase [Komagataella phaffii CBS 7435]
MSQLKEGLFKLFDLPTWCWLLVFVYATIPLTFYYFLPMLGSCLRKRSCIADKAVILVMGDLGHSPRMNNHALSFSRIDYQVELCGYIDSKLAFDIMHSDNISINQIQALRNTVGLPYFLFAMWKIVYQLLQLLKLLMRVMQDSRYILVQNPPGIPSILVIVILKKVLFPHCKLIIDWHNLNYTILNLKYQNLHHPFVRFLRFYEFQMSKYSDLNLTVSESMNKFLQTEFGISSAKLVTLYDRAPTQFKPILDPFQKESVMKAHPRLFQHSIFFSKILVTSTSFTQDEDLPSFLKALKFIDCSLKCKILVIVTGKGPLKNNFEEQCNALTFSNILVKTCWLSPEDYPKILAISDLGVSLHVSSSGIDLPMKVVDLFGCGVPVASLKFDAITELIKEDVNGVLCDDAFSLGTTIQRLFENAAELQALKQGALEESLKEWNVEWNKKLGSLLT